MRKSITDTRHDDLWYQNLFETNRPKYLPNSGYSLLSEDGQFGSEEGYHKRFQITNPDILVDYSREGKVVTVTVDCSMMTFLKLQKTILDSLKRKS